MQTKTSGSILCSESSNGVTGAIGTDIWGWVTAGYSGSGGQFAAKINDIDHQLKEIAGDLNATNALLREISCELSSLPEYPSIQTIGGYYDSFDLWDKNPKTIPELPDLVDWAVQVTGMCPPSVSNCPDTSKSADPALLNIYNTATGQSNLQSSIENCLSKVQSLPTKGTLDDRPFYASTALPLQHGYLNTFFQGLVVSAEANHILALNECITKNGEAKCVDNTANSTLKQVTEKICPTTGPAPSFCGVPYDRWRNDWSNWLQGIFEQAGAPYSTGIAQSKPSPSKDFFGNQILPYDGYVMVNGKDYLLATSLEAYTWDAGGDFDVGCNNNGVPIGWNFVNDPIHNSLSSGESTLSPIQFGATCGTFNSSIPSIGFGWALRTEGYGGGGPNGQWVTAPEDVFSDILGNGFNGSGNESVKLADYLCTGGLNAPDDLSDPECCSGKLPVGTGASAESACCSKVSSMTRIDQNGNLETTQICSVPAATGLYSYGPDASASDNHKIVLFDQTSETPDSPVEQFESVHFLDTAIRNGDCLDVAGFETSGCDMPFGASQSWIGLTVSKSDNSCGTPTFQTEYGGSNVFWYDMYTHYNFFDSNCRFGQTSDKPQWSLDEQQTGGGTLNAQFLWPALDWSKLMCNDDTAAAQAKNPSGVPTMCGDDFEFWYEQQVPAGPGSTTATADTEAGMSMREKNGKGSTLSLGREQNGFALVAFDKGVLESFFASGPIGRARLVLTTADEAAGARGQWVTVSPLRAQAGRASEACTGDAADLEADDECLRAWRVQAGRGTTEHLEEGHVGPVAWDVTDDVKGGVTAWRLRRGHGSGSLSFHSREGAEELGDPSLAPTLILNHAIQTEFAQSE